ncbi:MAG: hypothetical protein AAF657_11840 [Acidobacteriota bacterium]
MSSIFNPVVVAIALVAGTTIAYKLLPFKTWTKPRPRFVLFPKYSATYRRPREAIESTLVRLGFERTNEGTYVRGKVYGDFSAKAIRLRVEVDDEARQIKVYSPFFGIVFDTGDVWQLASDIVQGDE